MATSPRVIVVDDDPLVLAVTRRVLLRAGYDVATFESPLRALEDIAGRPPFAVVADLNMPDMSGGELLARVAQVAPDSLRVLYTGDGELKELEASLPPTLTHAVLTKSGGMQLLPDALARLR